MCYTNFVQKELEEGMKMAIKQINNKLCNKIYKKINFDI